MIRVTAMNRKRFVGDWAMLGNGVRAYSVWAADDLQCRRLGGRNVLLLRGQGPHLRKTWLFERFYLPHLWTRRPFGAICITRGPEKSPVDLSGGHGADLCAGVLHQLVYGGRLPYALVGLQPQEDPAQRPHLSAEQPAVRSGLRAVVPCCESASDGVAVPHRLRLHHPCGSFLFGLYLMDNVLSVRSAIQLSHRLDDLQKVRQEIRSHLEEKAAQLQQKYEGRLEEVTDRFMAGLEDANDDFLKEKKLYLAQLRSGEDLFERRLLRSHPDLRSKRHSRKLLDLLREKRPGQKDKK